MASPVASALDTFNLQDLEKSLSDSTQEKKTKMDHSTYIYGVRYPNRVFVGGLPRETNATDLADFFSKFGQVTESKVILNEDGTSKGYGFITFATSDDVAGVFGQGVIFYKQKKLNLGPAIRKQAPETPGEPIYMLNMQSRGPQAPSPPPHPQASPPHSQASPPSPPHPLTRTSKQPLWQSPQNSRPRRQSSPQTLEPALHMAPAFQQHCYQSVSMVNAYPPTVPNISYAHNLQWFPTMA